MIDKGNILKTKGEIKEFISKNRNCVYNSTLITKQMYDRFDVLDFIDDFSICEQSFVSGHGSSDCIPYISVPSVSEETCGSDAWYVLRVGVPAPTSVLRRILNGYSKMLRDNY